jgi:uncharacterized membrane protein YjgN (DUF898 family)
MNETTIVTPSRPQQAIAGSVPTTGPGAAPRPQLAPFPAPFDDDAPLRWDGRATDLVGIHLGNLMLTLLTLGIFRFWAIVRVRRYVWSHLLLFRDRLEYTGTGGELLRGLLKAVAVMLPLYLLLLLAQLLTGGDGPAYWGVQGAYILALFYLFGVARHAARRYMANRTSWRGIRLAVAGSPWRFGFVQLGWAVAGLLTLGLARPWAAAAEARWSLGRLHLGTQPFAFTGSGRQLLRPYLAALLFVALPAALLGWLAWRWNLGDQLQQAAMRGATTGRKPGAPMDEMAMARMAVLLALPAFAALAALLPFALVSWFAYGAAVMRWQAANTTLGGARFAMPSVSGWNLARLTIGNWLIVILTVGLGRPIVVRRNAAYLARRLTIDRAPDLSVARQAASLRQRSGEGLANLLDSGVGFGV